VPFVWGGENIALSLGVGGSTDIPGTTAGGIFGS